MSNAPANWYPDPTGRFEHRFWDGQNWTQHVGANGAHHVDPLPLAAAIVETESGGRVPGQRATEVVAAGPEVTEGAPAEVDRRTPAASSVPPRHSRRQAKRQGRDEFESMALAAAHGDPDAITALPALLETAAKNYRKREFEAKKWDTVAIAIRDVLDDDVLTAQEEDRLAAFTTAIDVDMSQLADHNFALLEELAIAAINDGRLPEERDTPLMPKPGEVVRMSFPVALMKEVAVREFRGGSRGVSVHIAKGVNYRVGAMRGHSVVVGTRLETQDRGSLVVTDSRAVFVGDKRTLEFRYDRLVGMEQFTDGLRLNVSNRQLASLFTFPPKSSPAVAAALIAHRE